ncbi:TfoX/Sxy family protein [Chitinophagaceae bacterium MMS25-I14]
MPYYNEQLTNRVREALMDAPGLEEKVMFSGICFMVDGKMCMGVSHDELMCRVGEERFEEALEKNGCREMRMKDRVMKGYVFVDPGSLRTKKELDYWVNLCLEFNPKAKASKKKKK